jgi:hypothetical protein
VALARSAPLLLVATIGLAGCGDGGDTTVIQTVSTETVPREDTTEKPKRDRPTTTTAAESESQDVGDQFYSPSRNIGCVISADQAGCAVNEYTYSPPIRPGDCDLEWGRSVGVTPSGPGEFTCIGGLLAEPSSPTLEYGQSTSAGSITCSSSEAGIRCENNSGHGFLLARERAEVY